MSFAEYQQFRISSELTNCLIENEIDPITFAKKAKKILESQTPPEQKEEAVYLLLSELSMGGMAQGVKNWFSGTPNQNPGTGYTNMQKPGMIGKAFGSKPQYGSVVGQDQFTQSANQGVNIDPKKKEDYVKAVNGLYGILQPLKNLGFNIRNIQDIIAKLKNKVNVQAPSETDHLVNKMRQMRGQQPGIQQLAPLPQQ